MSLDFSPEIQIGIIAAIFFFLEFMRRVTGHKNLKNLNSSKDTGERK
ncbi:MAG: hypothetical protein ACLPY5_05980 [Candidatus Bathyarchaeia archaeon]